MKTLDEAASHTVEGSGPTVDLANGGAATLLLHVVRRFHYEIDRLREKDVTGHTTSREVRRPHESNHLSGTATAIRPHAHPLGGCGGLYPQEPVVVRDILAELDGAVVWGGDFVPPRESRFELAPGPARPKARGVARKLRSRRDVPGLGAGTAGVFDPERRAAVKAFGRRNAS